MTDSPSESNDPATQLNQAPAPPAEPDQTDSLLDSLSYGLSLPERTARAASAMAGGLAQETAGWMLPAAFRSSKTYSAFVQDSLDVLIHDVGGVPDRNPKSASPDECQLAQKAISGLLDVVGSSTMHLSPIMVLAVASDVAYGSSHYLHRLSDELKREGVIDKDSSIDHVSDLLSALHRASDDASATMRAPPLDPESLAESVEKVVAEIKSAEPGNVLPQREIDRLWQQIETTADRSGVGIREISATVTLFTVNQLALTARGALSTVRVTGDLLDEQLLSHYRDALVAIADRGLYPTLAESAEPYLEACWHNFDEDRETWTQSLLSGQAWRSAKDWIAGGDGGE